MESYALLCKHLIMLMADAFIIKQTCEVNIWEPLFRSKHIKSPVTSCLLVCILAPY